MFRKGICHLWCSIQLPTCKIKFVNMQHNYVNLQQGYYDSMGLNMLHAHIQNLYINIIMSRADIIYLACGEQKYATKRLEKFYIFYSLGTIAMRTIILPAVQTTLAWVIHYFSSEYFKELEICNGCLGM